MARKGVVRVTSYKDGEKPDLDLARQVDRICSDFEEAWNRNDTADVGEFLPEEGRVRDAALKSLVHIDMERRLKKGRQTAVEEYLDRFPELATDRSAVVALISREFEIRKQAGSDVKPMSTCSGFLSSRMIWLLVWRRLSLANQVDLRSA